MAAHKFINNVSVLHIYDLMRVAGVAAKVLVKYPLYLALFHYLIRQLPRPRRGRPLKNLLPGVRVQMAAKGGSGRRLPAGAGIKAVPRPPPLGKIQPVRLL